MLRVSQAGKQSRRFSDIADALRIGELMQIDNPYDEVFFEQEMHGQHVPCGCFRALAPKPAGIWRGVAFGAYYCTGEDGVTRQLDWRERLDASQKFTAQREAIEHLRREYRLGNITREALEVGLEELETGGVREGRATTPIVRHALAETERSKIKDALFACGWNVSRAAEKLHVPRTTLLSRIDRLNIVAPAKH